ncbi:MAG: ATP-binding cassette domain-containing protein [Spirochaetaceae bacterium]|jgi:ABC-type dipeptide/oligopeptide/nickel transport system ATPase component|nr:ATP-binding cassette domain-containing protein [Spirochaetaceae bacterium]
MLKVTGLSIRFPRPGGAVEPVRDFSLSLGNAEILGLQGPSGCGKTVFCSALLGMVEYPGFVRAGSIHFSPSGKAPVDLTRLSERAWQGIRGKSISLISQNPIQGLNHAQKISTHFIDAVRAHEPETPRAACLSRAESLLDAALFSRPAEVLRRYPFELSGGMCQRVIIALSLLHKPDLLIADEPTTALDMRSEAEVLRLFRWIRETFHTAILLVSHDTRVLSRAASGSLRSLRLF